MTEKSQELINKLSLELDEAIQFDVLLKNLSKKFRKLWQKFVTIQAGKQLEKYDDKLFAKALEELYGLIPDNYHTNLDNFLEAVLRKDPEAVKNDISDLIVKNINILDDEYEEVIIGAQINTIIGLCKVYVQKSRLKTDPPQGPPDNDPD